VQAADDPYSYSRKLQKLCTEVATSRSFLQVVLTAVGESVSCSGLFPTTPEKCSRGLINSFFGAIDMSHYCLLWLEARRYEARFGGPDTG